MENPYEVTVKKVIAYYDKDGDGQLTAEEIKPFFDEYILPRINDVDKKPF